MYPTCPTICSDIAEQRTKSVIIVLEFVIWFDILFVKSFSSRNKSAQMSRVTGINFVFVKNATKWKGKWNRTDLRLVRNRHDNDYSLT